ncbi:hypothetical protein PL9631_600056 [Planktothrix paucivesiculata PCC 9631]|uniref:Uncharacterized protein n=1 Tax=Planktothrix paucivesiculata PCC 9631 TaxID=671071 RepID=A0A7Z9E1Z5_9CYAN|nr:hypothetical protein PL9631_600056 [Planktothrix paucivesiculata PCC 9631]
MCIQNSHHIIKTNPGADKLNNREWAMGNMGLWAGLFHI